jgi:hypothetical protein
MYYGFMIMVARKPGMTPRDYSTVSYKLYIFPYFALLSLFYRVLIRDRFNLLNPHISVLTFNGERRYSSGSRNSPSRST